MIGSEESPDFASKLIAQAEGLFDVKRYNEALAKAAEAIAVNPNRADAYGLQAGIFLRLEKYEESAIAAENLCRLQPESEWGFRLRSIALRHLKRLEEALSAATEAVKLRPEIHQTHVNLANVLLALDRRAEATLAGRKARELSPESDSPLEALGRVALLEGKKAEAEEYFREGLKLAPNSESLLFNLALSLEKQGKKQESIEFYRLAAAANPQDAMTRARLKGLVQSYAGGIGLGIFALVKVLSVVGRSASAAVAVIVGVTVVASLGYVLCRAVTTRRRRKAIHPTVLKFVDEEIKVERRNEWMSTLRWTAGLLVALFVARGLAILIGLG